MHVHQEDGCRYYDIKAEIEIDVKTMLGLRGISTETIARLWGDEVSAETEPGSEERMIMGILFYYFLLELTDTLPQTFIERLKKSAAEIISEDMHFKCLNDEENRDFMLIVHELDKADIGVLDE